MKKLLYCGLLIASALLGKAQHLSNTDTGKYRINLPAYWGKGNKVWQILTDKLPLVCEELKDKELCGDDCHPKYSIEFQLSEPVVQDYYPIHVISDNTVSANKQATETWDIETRYSFECSLLLFDDKDKLLTRLILVDTNEVFRVIHRVNLLSFTAAPPTRYAVRRPTRTETVFVNLDTYNSPNITTPTSGQTGQTPNSYINENPEKLAPGRKDLLAVVDAKLRAL